MYVQFGKLVTTAIDSPYDFEYATIDKGLVFLFALILDVSVNIYGHFEMVS